MCILRFNTCSFSWSNVVEYFWSFHSIDMQKSMFFYMPLYVNIPLLLRRLQQTSDTRAVMELNDSPSTNGDQWSWSITIDTDTDKTHSGEAPSSRTLHWQDIFHSQSPFLLSYAEQFPDASHEDVGIFFGEIQGWIQNGGISGASPEDGFNIRITALFLETWEVSILYKTFSICCY